MGYCQKKLKKSEIFEGGVLEREMDLLLYLSFLPSLCESFCCNQLE